MSESPRQRDPIQILWLAGGSCEGCTMAMLGAASPSIEMLLLNKVAGLPPLRLIHPLFALEAGDTYLAQLEQTAVNPNSTAILVIEGTLFDPVRAGNGSFSGMGKRKDGRFRTITDWIDQLAPLATAIVALGTCATWGGVPAAAGNPTGAMSLTDYLGQDFRSLANLPIINIPGCAPHGENFIETIIYLLLHLEQQVPLELDNNNRPAWLYQHQTYAQPAETHYLPQPAHPLTLPVHCGVPQHGWMNHVGGCATVGGACNGCTMPGFPDQFLEAMNNETMNQ